MHERRTARGSERHSLTAIAYATAVRGNEARSRGALA